MYKNKWLMSFYDTQHFKDCDLWIEGTCAAIQKNYQPDIIEEYDFLKINNLTNFHYIYYFILTFKRKNAFSYKGEIKMWNMSSLYNFNDIYIWISVLLFFLILHVWDVNISYETIFLIRWLKGLHFWDDDAILSS